MCKLNTMHARNFTTGDEPAPANLLVHVGRGQGVKDLLLLVLRGGGSAYSN